jgi:hypothetical protein
MVICHDNENASIFYCLVQAGFVLFFQMWLSNMSFGLFKSLWDKANFLEEYAKTTVKVSNNKISPTKERRLKQEESLAFLPHFIKYVFNAKPILPLNKGIYFL